MKKMINSERIEGRVYQHNLEIKTVQNKESANYGKEFISGTLDVATDEDGLNVLSTHFTYVTEMTSSGKISPTYGVLKNIIENGRTWLTDGKDAAMKVRINTALALNDFYNNEDQLVSAKRNEGGFVNIVNGALAPEIERNTFDFDILITSVNPVENENGNYLTLRGAIFNFRNAILPVELVVRSEDGMRYFESLDVTNASPVFTEVKGKIVSTTIEKKIEEESAFGSASVRTVSRTTREWVVEWARPVEYDYGSEDVLTAEDIQKAIQDREVYLAGIKKRRDDYMASRAAATSTANTNSSTSIPSGPAGGFNF